MIRLGNLVISNNDLAIIAHVVHNETPEEWATRAYNHPKGGAAAVKAKIARHRASWLAARGDVGYKTAAQKMADRAAASAARYAQSQQDAAAREAAAEAALDARIAAEVARQIAALP